MAKGIIEIIENRCTGCGFCEISCKKKCIEMTEKISSLGMYLPEFKNPEDCIACSICAIMCPHVAIDVYELVEAST